MSSILSSQGVVLATAMAVSGTVILLALRLQKSSQTTQYSIDQIPRESAEQVLRSCISSEDVVDPRGNGEEFRRQHGSRKTSSSSSSSPSSSTSLNLSSPAQFKKSGGMPANRVALYNGILRDRVIPRVAYSH
ncbi:hypothetical protein JRO89_XS04G0252100 [Xanthoceras sorbifolium]|uniref:Uncharacterized protein n=1 Tax=Xanthoceras sorbifolium TaxID=99658 RepID=A0ABQ8I7B6_9ROSI|nr:hypothetical protein JRO89_XS04G0252100 [Xanthoceras sorbifolium]